MRLTTNCMWMHCPLQAQLCYVKERLPDTLLARDCFAKALEMAIPSKTGRNAANKLVLYYDQLWTVRAASAPQTVVNELNCKGCPVQDLRDSPGVYDYLESETERKRLDYE